MHTKSRKALGLLLTVALLFTISLATQPEDFEPELADVDEDLSALSGDRVLAETTYPSLRIHPIYTGLSVATKEFQEYFQNDLVPPVVAFFQAALKVKYPIASKLSFKSSVTSMCGQSVPSELYSGVAADMAYFFSIKNLEDSSTVASSYACFLASGTYRPIVGTTWFNIALFKATTDVLLHEKNTYMLMHEFTHSLGFASSMYKYFVDDNGKRLTGHIKSATLDGATSVVLDVEPLTSKLRTFFGCSTLAGAYMENGGSSGTAGSHFERRQFVFEAMSSPLIYEQAYSQFTLALLEGSGWYTANYSMADPYWFGQGEGCSFLTGTCSASSYDEWCTGSSRGCTVTGRGGGSCSADIRSDSCRYQYPNVNYDCENPNAEKYARYPSVQSFGRYENSKCFTGTLSETSSSDSSTSFCFRYKCVGEGLSTTLRVYIGNLYYVCKYKGTLSPAGYKGHIDCPDPLTFCSTVGQSVCPRGCMGRGNCVDGTCVCNDGFTGKDCGLTEAGL